MKLFRLVVLLLAANLGFLVWSQGWLAGVAGIRADPQREPERAARQFQPQLLRIVPAPAAAQTACLEAGPFAGADAAAAEALLQAALPASGWSRRAVAQPGGWMVYSGRYVAADALQRRIDELQRLELAYTEVTSPPDLAPGLALGRYPSREAADRALDELAARGVRGLRVVAFAETNGAVVLRVERADAALRARLLALQGNVAGQPLGKAFEPCAP